MSKSSDPNHLSFGDFDALEPLLPPGTELSGLESQTAADATRVTTFCSREDELPRFGRGKHRAAAAPAAAETHDEPLPGELDEEPFLAEVVEGPWTQAAPLSLPKKPPTKPSIVDPSWRLVAVVVALVAAGFIALVVLAGVVVLRIRHPDGRETTVRVPEGASASVQPDGSVEVVLPEPLPQPPPAPAGTGRPPALPPDFQRLQEEARQRHEEFRQRIEAEQANRPSFEDRIASHFVEMLQHGSDFVREHAAEELVSRATPGTIPALIQALNDKSPKVRSCVIQALGRLKAESAAEPLTARLRVDADRAAASQALRQIGTAAAPAVVACLEDESAAVRQEACRILAVIPCEPAMKLDAMRKVAGWLSHEDESVREAAMANLRDLAAGLAAASEAKSEPAPAIPDSIRSPLVSLLQDEDPAVRLWTVRLAGRCQPLGTAMAEPLTKMVGDESAEVRQETATVVNPFEGQPEIGAQKETEVDGAAKPLPAPAKLVDTLIPLLQNENADARYWSAQLLGHLGGGAQAAIPALIELCADAQAPVQYAAAAAIVQQADTIADESPLIQKLHGLADKINALPHPCDQQARELEGDILKKLERIWPVEADTREAFGSRGLQSTTGPNSIEWFGYGGAGNWRVFQVKPNRELLLRTRGDNDPKWANMIGDIRFTISEWENGAWVQKQSVDGPTNFFGYRWYFYTPTSDRVRITARGWFYLYMYQL